MAGRVGFVLSALVFAPLAGAAALPTLPGTWQRLPAAPAAAAIPYARVAVWTGKEMIVFGRAGTPGAMRNVAFSYAPSSRRWRTLSPPKGDPGSYEGSTGAVWTGKLMLVIGPFMELSYEPATNRWRQLPNGPNLGAPSRLLVWTGKDMITWGGGCCGEASPNGAAYDPASGKWRTLAKAPIAAQQGPAGAWTGKELVVLPGVDPDGKPTGGAAYDPVRDTWRKVPNPPQQRIGSNVAWDGRELLVVAGSGPIDPKTAFRHLATLAYAFDPATNRWRTLTAMDNGRYGRQNAAVVWAGTKLLLWGGRSEAIGQGVVAPHGLAYDPKRNRWWQLPGAPLLPRDSPAAVWTGRALIVWGGDLSFPTDTSDGWPLMDGATYTPGA
jgi:hypothetical protein